VSKELLNGPNVVVGLKEVAGKAVPEGMRGDTLGDLCFAHCGSKCLLHMRFMQMIPFSLSGLWNMGQIGGREKPLPDKLPGAVWVFLFNPGEHEHAVIAGFQIFCVQFFDLFQMKRQLGHELLRQWYSAILFSLAVVDGQNSRIKVEGIDPEPQAFK